MVIIIIQMHCHMSPALCVVKIDANQDTLHILQFVAVCPHSHLEKQSDTAKPDIVRRKIKVSVVTPPTCIVQRLGRDREDTVHLIWQWILLKCLQYTNCSP